MQLQQTVLDQELCTLCGACLTLCPYLRSHQGRVVLLHDCDLDPGRCHASCPRTALSPGHLERAVFGEPGGDVTLGRTLRVMMGRATAQARRGAQNGGTVTALVLQALAGRTIDAAVLTRRQPDQTPRSVVARTAEAVLACSGSSYVAGPTLEPLGSQEIEATDRVGVVALPCQVQGLAKMRAAAASDRGAGPAGPVALVIGLFCTWALSWAPFRAFLRRELGGRAVQRVDISPPPARLLVATTDEGEHALPLDRVRALIRPACAVCVDLTAELADVSVGASEREPGWNTVIVRSPAGLQLVERAQRDGVLETRPLADEDLSHLCEASLAKKQRALAALQERGPLDQSYLAGAPEWIARVRGSGEEAS